MRRTSPEGNVKRAITDLLDAEKIWWMRCQTGFHVLEGANGKRRVFRAGRVGMADLLALPVIKRLVSPAHILMVQHAVPLWIECKRPKGGIHSPDQKAFQAEVEAAGHSYLLANSVDPVLAWLRGKL